MYERVTDSRFLQVVDQFFFLSCPSCLLLSYVPLFISRSPSLDVTQTRGHRAGTSPPSPFRYAPSLLVLDRTHSWVNYGVLTFRDFSLAVGHQSYLLINALLPLGTLIPPRPHPAQTSSHPDLIDLISPHPNQTCSHPDVIPPRPLLTRTWPLGLPN